MSDGGKGSAPRPYSVSQEKFGNNFDRIFGKKKVAETQCYCYNCNKDRIAESGWPFVMIQMILCPTCGNKRCPHSTDHNLDCTNSNDPGQPGSRY
jgi:hypothetical protein